MSVHWRPTKRLVTVTVLAAIVLVVVPLFAAGPVGATPISARATSSHDPQIVITGSVDVRSDQTVGNVVILNGDARIAGRVDGYVFALNGDVSITGSVRHSVTATNGRVVLSSNARVGGDVTSRDQARIARGASVGGDVRSVRRRFALGQFLVFAAFAFWLATIASTLVFGLLLLLIAPRAADAFVDTGRTLVWPTIGLGVAAAIGFPIVGLLLLASLVGLPLGAVVLLGLGFLYTLAFVVAAYFLGRLILPERRWLAYLVGWAILSVAGLIPVLNVLVLIAATIFGLGMVVLTVIRVRQAPQEREAAGERAVAPATPPEPPRT